MFNNMSKTIKKKKIKLIKVNLFDPYFIVVTKLNTHTYLNTI